MSKEKSEFIGSIEASKILNVSRQWVARLCKQGGLEANLIGRDWVIERRSVAEYQARRKRKGKGQ
jgi:excisionase family DNA binding protein